MSIRLLIVGVVAVIALVSTAYSQPSQPPAQLLDSSQNSTVLPDTLIPPNPVVLPRLLELGSIGCQACKKMAPIIEELKEEYSGRLSVEFYDVRKDPAPARQYGIRLIPTQIFINANGKEIFRHEGFFPKEEILPILAQMGVKN